MRELKINNLMREENLVPLLRKKQTKTRTSLRNASWVGISSYSHMHKRHKAAKSHHEFTAILTFKSTQHISQLHDESLLRTEEFFQMELIYLHTLNAPYF